MSTGQQEEALRYFESHAGEWKSKAESSDAARVNVIQQRNGYVLHVISERDETGTALDVGCGTGELVCDMAKKGIAAMGVDIAPEMIHLASMKAKNEGLGKARFEACSIFDYDFSQGPFDVICANGFIEYISREELNSFFDLVSGALAPGGSFIVGSRNRLFNLFSLNGFTLHELGGEGLHAMIKEAVMLAAGGGVAGLEGACAPPQEPEIRHAGTGIDVTTRFQYTPLQLIRMLKERGLAPMGLLPVHIHGVPPVFKEKHPDLHGTLSNLLQTHAHGSMELVPFASSFMLHVKRG